MNDCISKDDLWLNFKDSNIKIPELIGKGSYGKVYKLNNNICYKKFNLFLYESSPGQGPGNPGSGKKEYTDVYIVENNLKEVVFYKLLNRKIKSIKDSFTLTFFIITNDKNKIKHIPRPSYISYTPELFLNNSNEVDLESGNNLQDVGIKIYFQNYGLSLNKYSFVSKEIFMKIFSQICNSILLFFKSNMSHGDLKPSNILLKITKLHYNLT